MNKKILMLVFTVLLCPSVIFAETFYFTAIPDQDETRLLTRFNKIAHYLQKSIDVEVKYIPVKSYAAAVTAFQNNQVQLAWFGGLSGVRARNLVKDSQAIAQGVEDKSFVTYFIAHSSTGLDKSDTFPETIADKSFIFGSKGSTSGRLMPEFYIREYFSKAPEDVFSRVGFSGNHSRTIALVQTGAFEVGATNFKVWNKEMELGKIDNSKVKIIWQTPPYPDYNWTIRGGADQRFGKGFTDKVQKALLDMNDPALLDSFPRSAFIPVSNADYQPIYNVGKDIGLLD